MPILQNIHIFFAYPLGMLFAILKVNGSEFVTCISSPVSEPPHVSPRKHSGLQSSEVFSNQKLFELNI